MSALKERYDYNGNAVIVPKREREFDDEKLKKIKKERQEELRRKLNERNKARAKLILFIFACFIIGFSLLYRYCEIYTLQNNLVAAQLKENNIKRSNQDLQYSLAQNNNIGTLEQKAAALNMTLPDSNSVVYVNLNKKTVVAPSVNNTDSSKKVSFIDFIKNIFAF